MLRLVNIFKRRLVNYRFWGRLASEYEIEASVTIICFLNVYILIISYKNLDKVSPLTYIYLSTCILLSILGACAEFPKNIDISEIGVEFVQ